MKFLTVAATLATSAFALTNHVKENVRSNFGEDKLIALSKGEITDVIHQILHDHGVDSVGHQDGKMHFKLSPNALEALDSEGVLYHDHTEEFISNMERNLNSENFVCSEGAEACASQQLDEFYSSYQDLAALEARFEGFAASNPSITSLDSLGKTFEGRDQTLLWIGDDGSKPIVFYFCGIHAREWITPMFCTYMAEALLDTSNEASQELLKNYTFAITPSANPDGYVHTHEVDNAWRKTRQPNEGSRCIGTDPNRNYATGFGGPGASANPCSDTYHGEFPFDQMCTNNIKTFTDNFASRIIHVNDVHAYGEYWMSPFAGTTNLPVDVAAHDQCNKAVYDAIKANSGLEFKIGPVATTIYEASGGAVDYFYEENAIIHSYTYEARGGGRTGLAGFQPPTSNIMPSNIEMYEGLYAAMKCIWDLEVEGNDPVPVPCEDSKSNCNSFSCFQEPNSCKETCGLCSEVAEENVPETPTQTVVTEQADLGPLVGAVVFLGIGVAAVGAIMAVMVHKMGKQQNQDAVANEGKLNHFELN